MKKLLLIATLVVMASHIEAMITRQEMQQEKQQTKSYGTENNPVIYTYGNDNVAQIRGLFKTYPSPIKPVLDEAGQKIATVETIYRIKAINNGGSGSYTVTLPDKTQQKIYFYAQAEQHDR